MSTNNRQCDIVIIGGGTAGAAMAARLSEDGQRQVILVEAGGPDRHPFIHIPFGLAGIPQISSIGWRYYTEPQQALNERRLFWPRGKTLGGSSSINAMCYIRCAEQDYDRWAEQGADGWDWASVAPYFKKLEGLEQPSHDGQGRDGPLGVTPLRHHDPLTDAFIDAAEQAGHPLCDDFNQRHRQGMGLYQVMQRDGRRCSAARAYLKGNTDRDNLTVLTHTKAERIVFEGTRATGVVVSQRDQRFTINAREQVILSGGAINSPQLLMLSGIGPQAHLQEQGIDVLVDLPGVGENLQDHLDVIVRQRLKQAHGYGIGVAGIPEWIKAGWDYMFKRQGRFASNIAEGGGFASTSHAKPDEPDLQFHFLPAQLHDHGRRLVTGYGTSLHVCHLYPQSRGRVRLNTGDPRHAPSIDPNYLSVQEDWTALREGVKMARDIAQQSALDVYGAKEVDPGPECQTDAELDAYIRESAETIYHPVGTCRMGRDDDPMSVTDNALNVRGTTHLKVIDASVMPSVPGGNTTAPTLMIAEKAAAAMNKA